MGSRSSDAAGDRPGRSHRQQPGDRDGGGAHRARRPRCRRVARAGGAVARPGHREDAGDRRCRPGGRRGLPQPSVPDPVRVRGHRLLPALPAPRRDQRGSDRPQRLLPRRCRLLGGHRLRGDVAGRARERPGGRGRPRRRRADGDEDRVPHRRRGRHVHRRPRPVRRLPRGPDLQGQRSHRPRGVRLRCRPARDVHASRRRDLHQGRRRRGRPGGQGGAGHPRGRPAQRRHDRRQRR